MHRLGKDRGGGKGSSSLVAALVSSGPVSCRYQAPFSAPPKDAVDAGHSYRVLEATFAVAVKEGRRTKELFPCLSPVSLCPFASSSRGAESLCNFHSLRRNPRDKDIQPLVCHLRAGCY